jgi:hypothetical protein
LINNVGRNTSGKSKCKAGALELELDLLFQSIFSLCLDAGIVEPAPKFKWWWWERCELVLGHASI